MLYVLLVARILENVRLPYLGGQLHRYLLICFPIGPFSDQHSKAPLLDLFFVSILSARIVPEYRICARFVPELCPFCALIILCPNCARLFPFCALISPNKHLTVPLEL